MAYRTIQRTKPGKVFCIPMLEWHVQCGEPDCEIEALVAPIMMAWNTREADLFAERNEEGELSEWRKENGLWYCPLH